MKKTSHRNKKGFSHKKSLGQNFLKDKRVLEKIVEACCLQSKETVFEIGPGQGVLTEMISPRVDKVIVVEKDRRLIPELKSKFQGKNVEVIEGDFLETDLAMFNSPIKLVGNIPYYITTPIIEKVIQFRRSVTSANLMVQWEYGQRLKASPGTKAYGALTCFVNYYADIEVLFKIKRTCFQPAPKVDSCFLRIQFLSEPRVCVKNEKLFFELIRKAFQQRRKTLLNALASMMEKELLVQIFADVEIKSTVRGEELGLEDFARLANRIEKMSDKC